nr:uncharacterized protein LOC111511085 [Leptinotarsa decemlineata]
MTWKDGSRLANGLRKCVEQNSDAQLVQFSDGDVCVYRKHTHTYRYLHVLSNQHISQKEEVISTLTERTQKICEPEHPGEELEHLQVTFRSNGYSVSEINKAMKLKSSTVQNGEETLMVTRAYLAHISSITDRIGKLSEKHNTKTVFKPTKKIQQILRWAKGKKDLLSAALSHTIYRIPCTFGTVYIGTTKKSMEVRLKKHQTTCKVGQTYKLAMGEHTVSEVNNRVIVGKH